MSGPNRSPLARPKVVILGAGFGGLFAAKALRRRAVDVTIVDRHNYHLFQPLLYQVAVAGLPPSDVAWPIRSILRRQKNATVLMAEVKGIDSAARRVLLDRGTLDYDYLIAATGATHSYFGHDDWRAVAPGLKSIDDATRIRRRILEAFEQAEMTDDPALRARLLTFAIVGAGPTGVELAGTIAELAHRTLAKDFRSIDPHHTRVVLVEAGPRILPALHASLGTYAQRALERLGVEVRTDSLVSSCDANGVVIAGERLESATVLWAAGVAASPVARWLGVPADRAGRVAVADDLSVPERPDVFVIGDAAAALDAEGRPVPGIAPAAKQQGRYVAEVVACRATGAAAPQPFRYRHVGNLATIGRQAAVIEFPFVRLTGWLAWWIWGIAHIYFLIGTRSRIAVAMSWLWSFVSGQHSARLITQKETLRAEASDVTE
jgi:NADH dehydrogenase